MITYPQLLRFLSAFLFLLTLAPLTSAQEKKPEYLGILVSGELSLDRFGPTIGIFYERSISQKLSAETGLFYRTMKDEFFVSMNTPTFSVSDEVRFVQGFVAIPLLVRYDARFAQISIGPQVDIFAKWHQIREGDISLEDFSRSPTVQVGPLLKVGRKIPFKGTLILEPELRLGIRSLSEGSEGYFGIGLKLKKSLDGR